MTFWAVIPARAGSKGIPNKNRFCVMGKELIRYTLEECMKVSALSRIILSTDDELIAHIASEYEGIECLFPRPQHLANDSAKIADVLVHVLDWAGGQPEFIVLLQPTAPLRKASLIDAAINFMIAHDEFDSLASVVRLEEPHPFKLKKIESGRLVPFIDNTNSEISRQDLPPAYKLNGAIYIVRTQALRAHKKILTNTYPFIMDSENSLNIDTMNDVVLFQEMLKREQGEKCVDSLD